MRWLLFCGLVFCVLGFGCLFQPYSEDVNLTKKTGCAYNDPPCGSNYSCINNSCILKTGCDYGNPSCQSNESCINNSCILKTGCAYDNPSCSKDYECVNNSCMEKTICGKFGCQAGEKSTCCQDCGCAPGYTCDTSGICLFNGTKLEITNVSVQSIPSTMLYAVPPKTIEASLGPLARITIKNTGTQKAYGVKIRSEVQGYSGTILYDLGMINPKEGIVFNITQRLDDDVLELTNGTYTKLKISLEYKGTAASYTDTSTSNIWLPGRNTFNWKFPRAAASWIDPTDQSVWGFGKDATANANIMVDDERKRAARQIYGHLQAFGMEHTGGSGTCFSDSLLFPAEALKTKNGGCGDLSVLYAALLESVKVKSAIIKTNDTVLSGYVRSDGTVVPVDLRGIEDTNFSDAVLSGQVLYQKNPIVVYPQDGWGAGTSTVDPKVTVLIPKIETTSQNCLFISDELIVNYWFENKGFDTGRRCLKAVLFEGKNEFLTKRVCVDVPKFEKRNVTFTIDVNGKHGVLTEKCWVD